MQIKTASDGKKKVVMSRKEWESIGKKAKWGPYQEEEKKIDRDTVWEAGVDLAESIFGKIDDAKLRAMVDSACEKGKDTEDAIAILQGMMRSD